MARLLISVVTLFGAPGGHHHAQPCPTVIACRAELTRARRAVAWQQAARRRLERHLARRWTPIVTNALRIASGASGVSYSALRSISWCESRFDPYATNGQYRGLFQLSARHRAALESLFDVPWTDPYANATYSAIYMRAHGASEWQCAAGGGLRW